MISSQTNFTCHIGSTGSIGSIGSTGSTGSIASIGSTESTGSIGSIGSIGFTESIGSIGSTGSTGSTGFTGSTDTIVDFSRCSYVLRKGINKRLQCGKVSLHNNGFCDGRLHRRNGPCDILSESIIANNMQMIKKCLSEIKYANVELHEILKTLETRFCRNFNFRKLFID